MALRQQGRHACWEAQVSADTLAWHSQHAWRTSDHACAHHRHHPAAHTSSATHRRQGVSTRRCGRVRRRPASSTSRGHRVDRATRCRLPTMSPPRHGSCCRGCTPPSRYVWRAPSAPALSSPISPATRPLCGPPPPQTACLGPCVRAAYLHHVVTTRPSGFAYRALMQVEVSREKRAVQVPLEPAPPPRAHAHIRLSRFRSTSLAHADGPGSRVAAQETIVSSREGSARPVTPETAAQALLLADAPPRTPPDARGGAAAGGGFDPMAELHRASSLLRAVKRRWGGA
jgi:hypothetical protein